MPETINNFNLVYTSKPSACAKVRKYKSSVSGLTVVIADVAGPLVSGYFTLATEAFDDDGLPHTLEHLIFLGSKKYPYKGVLDLFANRNLADGTNAHTDTDHTSYTVRTVGSEGFINLLPVYLDHILHPTLTDAAYTTEVHHIDGAGNDAGVVYCEQQASENTAESLVYYELLASSYPGRCGYKSRFDGALKSLRESTNNQKVRNYHKEFYRPENLCLIIVGQINDEDVLKSLTDVEEEAKTSTRPPFQRPWQGEVPPLTKSVDKLVLYPSDEEDNGMIYVGFRGPSAVNEIYEMSACIILLRYLTESSISPLQKEFVEVADPSASSVLYSIIENAVTLLYISFENVPLPKLSEIKPRLDAKLREFVAGDETIDMKRIRTLIHRQRLEVLLNLETQPHNAVSFMLIGDMLYGHTNEQLDERLSQTIGLDKMEKEDASFWLGLLEKYLVNAPSVTIRGQPSIAERTRMAEEEDMRINDQVEKLGPVGLKKKAEELTNAINTNEKPVPSEMLTAMPLPDTGRITFHDVVTYSSESVEQPKEFNILNIPYFAHVDDMDSEFAYLMVLMDTSFVSEELRHYIPLYLESILELPILRNGVTVPYETVITELEQDTIAAKTSMGIYSSDRFETGPYGQSVALILQVEASKYERGVRWLHELLYQTQFTAERLTVIAAKAVNEVADFRRRGSKIASDMTWALLFKKDCNKNVNNMIRQHKFLSDIGKRLFKGDKTIITNLEKLRKILTDPKNIAIRLSAKLDRLRATAVDVANPWRDFGLPRAVVERKKTKSTPEYALLNHSSENAGAWILGLGSNESNYLCQTVPFLTDNHHPDLPALLVFVQYLVQLEGPMWKQLRGLGLTYDYRILPRTSEGMLYLTLFRSSSVVPAYIEAKKIVETYLNGTSLIDSVLLDSAKCSLINEIIEKEGTVIDKVRQNVLASFRDDDFNFNRNLVNKISGVNAPETVEAGKKYMASLFDPSKVKMTLVCHTSKVAELKTKFSELGFNVNECKSLNDFFLTS